MTDPYKELREGLGRLKASDGVLRGPEADVAALLAERDSLREALKKMMALYDGIDDQSAPGQYARQAREALAQEQGGSDDNQS